MALSISISRRKRTEHNITRTHHSHSALRSVLGCDHGEGGHMIDSQALSLRNVLPDAAADRANQHDNTDVSLEIASCTSCRSPELQGTMLHLEIHVYNGNPSYVMMGPQWGLDV